jgi:D-tagatose-1,6-bisphosphate aldolase subunit GatZ/KbaZ
MEESCFERRYAMMAALEKFLDLLRRNKHGEAVGQYSICSAHPDVIRAGLLQTKKVNGIALIEATCNQVDQYGGYTGMTPANFVSFAQQISGEVDLEPDRILFGGDHLGPNRWQGEPSSEAMSKAEALVDAYVRAGFAKIHLDASMRLADDNPRLPLDDETVASRAAALCKVAEKAGQSSGIKPAYVIGTEVPIPGGAQNDEEEIVPTSPSSARRTIETTKAVFEREGLANAWDRVCAVVVQPGVEFGDDQVIDYDRSKAADLRSEIMNYPELVCEAHSTDYQSPEKLRELVEDHFAILKVGPWLTYAWREAAFLLTAIEKVLIRDPTRRGEFKKSLEDAMLANPEHWLKHYRGSEEEIAYKRQFSYSDRCRYYLSEPSVQAAADSLIKNLEDISIPDSLISQFFPGQYWDIRNEHSTPRPSALLINHIRQVISAYSRACGS